MKAPGQQAAYFAHPEFEGFTVLQEVKADAA